MKKYLFILLLPVTIMACTTSQEKTGNAAVELSFTYKRLSGTASNQFAVWVEDEQGKFVKTLYATKFTAKGGWKSRETSIPVWVKKSGLANLTSTQVDSITGATPKTGTLVYTWDGTDSNGKALPVGNYILFLEGTLRRENQVLYRAPISLGKVSAAAEVSPEYKGEATADRSMISDVKVKTLR
jgi:hypothetical protein